VVLAAGHKLDFSDGGADIARWGTLTWKGSELEVVNRNGGVRRLDMVPEPPIDLIGWIDEADGLLVISGTASRNLSVIDLSFDELKENVALDRDPDSGMRSMNIFAVEDAGLCLLTESQILLLGPAGHLKWIKNHNDPSLSLAGVFGSLITLVSAKPRLDHTRPIPIHIDASTGAEIAVENDVS
jgi:hypothetical protein